jgi:hypothetical protein
MLLLPQPKVHQRHHLNPTECGRQINTPASYSEGPRLKSRRSGRLSWLKFFVVFISPSKEIPLQYLKLGHDRFLPYSLFINHAIIRRYTAGACNLYVALNGT